MFFRPKGLLSNLRTTCDLDDLSLLVSIRLGTPTLSSHVCVFELGHFWGFGGRSTGAEGGLDSRGRKSVNEIIIKRGDRILKVIKTYLPKRSVRLPPS